VLRFNGISDLLLIVSELVFNFNGISNLVLIKWGFSQICPETVMTTLYTAKKYAVPALEKNCVDYLKRHLCADNAFLLLTQARLFDEPQVLCFSGFFKSYYEFLTLLLSRIIVREKSFIGKSQFCVTLLI
jgi:hypothetical protein